MESIKQLQKCLAEIDAVEKNHLQCEENDLFDGNSNSAEMPRELTYATDSEDDLPLSMRVERHQ